MAGTLPRYSVRRKDRTEPGWNVKNARNSLLYDDGVSAEGVATVAARGSRNFAEASEAERKRQRLQCTKLIPQARTDRTTYIG